MNRLIHTRANRQLRQQRVRTRVRGSKTRPRLSVFISRQHISAQIINDSTHQTLVAASSVGQSELKGSLQAKAAKVGETLAQKAGQAKIKQVVLDRGSHLYHGRIKALAEAARSQGLEF